MTSESSPGLARRLGPFDAALLVMGGIVGSGIFMNPAVVAGLVATPAMALGAWVFGGIVALAGAFIYAELAGRRPQTGGQYAYLREAFHPGVAFVYGWSLLLVIQSGGMAAVALTFARYFTELTGVTMADWLIGGIALAALTVINCLGVRAGSTVQNGFMLLKVAAIASIVAIGLFYTPAVPMAPRTGVEPAGGLGLVTAFAAALVPVLFAYGGWQTASFVSGEFRQPRRDLPLGVIVGVVGVIILYTTVSFVCIRSLGMDALAATTAPATDVMRRALGDGGARFIAISITVSALGFLSQSMLTAPRVYFAMAEDGLFLKSVAWLHPRTHVPVVAIALQGLFAIVIAASGRYEQILNYVVSTDYIFFGLTALALFVFRRRDLGEPAPWMKAIGHPWTTIFFIASVWLVVLNAIVRYPENTVIGIILVCTGIPVYVLRRRWVAKR